MQTTVYLALNGGCKDSECSNAVDGHRDNEAYKLNNCHPPREARPSHTNTFTILHRCRVKFVHDVVNLLKGRDVNWLHLAIQV